MIGRCHKRSAELQLPHLEAYARLALAKFRWQHCMRPAEPLDHLGNGLPPPPRSYVWIAYSFKG